MQLPITRQSQYQKTWPITVAVIEHDPEKRKCLEQFLRQNDQSIVILTDQNSIQRKNKERRLKSRDNLSLQDNTIERIKRLKPRILFVNTHQLTKESIDLLQELNRNCSGTLPIVLIKEQADDSEILCALENGAHGIVNCSISPIDISKIIRKVDSGEPWVSRKLLEKIMGKIKLIQ